MGRESWGVFYALFVPVGEPADRPVRQTVLDADSAEGAQREVERRDEPGLRALLADSRIKE